MKRPGGETVNDPRDAWMSAALRSRAEHAHSRNDCPHPHRIWEAVRLQGSLDERLEIIDHLSDCPSCSEAWSLAAELATAYEQTAQPHASAFDLPTAISPAESPLVRTPYAKKAWLIGAAAVLLLGLGISFLVLRQTGQPTQASLPQGDIRLHWTPGPTGSRYDVIVMTPDKEVVAEAKNLEITEYRVPPERLARVTDRAALLWRVEAHTPDRLAVSSDILSVGLQQGTPPPATLPAVPDEAGIRALIADYETLLETRDLAGLRSTLPNASPATLGAPARGNRIADVETELRLDDVQDVAIEVLALRFEGRTAQARIRRQDTVRINGERQIRVYAQILTFAKIDAFGNWRMTAAPPLAIDK